MNNEKSDSSDLESLKKEITSLSERLSLIEKFLLDAKAGSFQTSKNETTYHEEGFEIKFPFQSEGFY